MLLTIVVFVPLLLLRNADPPIAMEGYDSIERWTLGLRVGQVLFPYVAIFYFSRVVGREFQLGTLALSFVTGVRRSSLVIAHIAVGALLFCGALATVAVGTTTIAALVTGTVFADAVPSGLLSGVTSEVLNGSLGCIAWGCATVAVTALVRSPAKALVVCVAYRTAEPFVLQQLEPAIHWVFPAHSWAVVRSGGTPDYPYWLAIATAGVWASACCIAACQLFARLDITTGGATYLRRGKSRHERKGLNDLGAMSVADAPSIAETRPEPARP